MTTNKLIATLAGELFDKHVQAYPRYGSEKKGLPTTYYLTVADAPIRTARGAATGSTWSRSTTSRPSAWATRWRVSSTAARCSSSRR